MIFSVSVYSCKKDKSLSCSCNVTDWMGPGTDTTIIVPYADGTDKLSAKYNCSLIEGDFISAGKPTECTLEEK